MSRCLRNEALVRVLAELATEGERAHLATCPSCDARQRRLLGDLDTIIHVLATTREPRVERAPAPRRWVAVTALSALAIAAIVGIEVAVWKAMQPEPESVESRQVAIVLADVSAALFSLDGEPDRVLGESLVSTLDPNEDSSASCEGSGDPAETGCPEGTSALEEESLMELVEAMEADAVNPDHVEAGG